MAHSKMRPFLRCLRKQRERERDERRRDARRSLSVQFTAVLKLFPPLPGDWNRTWLVALAPGPLRSTQLTQPPPSIIPNPKTHSSSANRHACDTRLAFRCNVVDTMRPWADEPAMEAHMWGQCIVVPTCRIHTITALSGCPSYYVAPAPSIPYNSVICDSFGQLWKTNCLTQFVLCSTLLVCPAANCSRSDHRHRHEEH